MALLHLKSTNKNLTFVLTHNPENPMIVKGYKKGAMIGYYPNNNQQEYCIYFKDSIAGLEKENGKLVRGNTFRPHVDSQYDYLCNNEFTDARFINAAFDSYLKSALKGGEYDTEKSDNELTVFSIETNKRVISLFQRSFKGIDITYESLYDKYFTITFKSNSTVQRLLKVVNVFGLFASLEGNENFIYVEEDLSEKYLKLLGDIYAPYFIRYVFKVNMLRSHKMFEKLEYLLYINQIEMCHKWSYGDTHISRIDYITNKLFKREKNNEMIPLGESCDIVDIGTGYDYRYLKQFQKTIETSGHIYHAIERDYDAYEKIKAKIEINKWNHVKIYNSLEEFLYLYNRQKVNVICSEVLEHNEVSEAKEIIDTVLSKLDFDTAIFTVPNKDFNKYYFDDENKMRHDDHKWEFTKEEFKAMVSDIFEESKATLENEFDYVIEDIGDIMSFNTSPTQSLIIKNKNKLICNRNNQTQQNKFTTKPLTMMQKLKRFRAMVLNFL